MIDEAFIRGTVMYVVGWIAGYLARGLNSK